MTVGGETDGAARSVSRNLAERAAEIARWSPGASIGLGVRWCLPLGRLTQILLNYLSNAIKFTAEGGRVIALTKHLAEAHGGSVGVRSTPGEGSTFHVVLPRQPVAKAPAHRRFPREPTWRKFRQRDTL
jgi:signal transduction histidine kinase